MKITIPYCYTEEEIPPRCRKPRPVEHVGEIGLTVHEVTGEAAPVRSNRTKGLNVRVIKQAA